MSYVTICSDSFNRADAALSGSTLNNAAGGTEGSDTWTIYGTDNTGGGSWNIVSNQSKDTGSDGYAAAVVGNTADVDKQKASMLVVTNDSGPVIRFNTSNNSYYLLYRYPGGEVVGLFKNTGGSFTAISGTGPTVIGSTDTVTLEGDGTTLNGYVNGGLEVTTTDTMNATGKPGLYGGGNKQSTYDDFKYEVVGSAVVVYPPASNLLLMGVA
jgi:hypothetical protein